MNNKPPFNTRYSDLLPDEDDPALSDLVRDLDALYSANPLPARLSHLQEVQSTHRAPSQDASGPQVGTFVTPRPSRRWSRLNTLAAVVLTIVLVGALAGTFYTLRNPSVAHKVPTPTPMLTPTSGVTSTPGITATPEVVLGPQPCPAAVANPTYWEPIIAPYAYGGSHHIEQVSCADMMGTSTLQALVTVRRADTDNTLDIFVFTNITNAQPTRIFQLMGLVKGDAKISGYSTVMTAQVDELSAINQGKPVSSMTADLFREFKWSASAGTLVQTVFPGIFPDLTRYQAEADQAQVNQGHQPWKLSATQVAVNLTVSLLDWSTDSTAILLSGGGAQDVNAVVRVTSTEMVSPNIIVTLSRLEGETNHGIWEVISVGEPSSLSITSPAQQSLLTNPVRVTGTGSAFEGVIGKIRILDHLYNSIGQTTAIGADGMGQTSFSNTVDYQSSFPAGTQEGVLILTVISNINGTIASAVMEKVLIKG